MELCLQLSCSEARPFRYLPLAGRTTERTAGKFTLCFASLLNFLQAAGCRSLVRSIRIRGPDTVLRRSGLLSNLSWAFPHCQLFFLYLFPMELVNDPSATILQNET